MILLDTNIISEVMKAQPAEAVLDWLDEQNSETLYVSTITVGEITYGLRILPDGKRRSVLRERFERFIGLAFEERVLPYDEPAARVYGELMGNRKELGRPMSVADGQIAAVARSNHLSVATRNVDDFRDCDVELINPFSVAGG